jgi:mono/diheme cytochrome c family protein
MTRSAWFFLFLLAALLNAAMAQRAAADDTLNDTQVLGQRLFTQSCVECHARPQLTSGQYGPVLSKESLGGQDGVMREVISNGTPRMPGFKFHFAPAQIDAIVAYLKTVPAPQPVAKAPAPSRTNQRDAD